MDRSKRFWFRADCLANKFGLVAVPASAPVAEIRPFPVLHSQGGFSARNDRLARPPPRTPQHAGRGSRARRLTRDLAAARMLSLARRGRWLTTYSKRHCASRVSANLSLRGIGTDMIEVDILTHARPIYAYLIQVKERVIWHTRTRFHKNKRK